MTARNEKIYLDDGEAYVSQTRVSMPLYKSSGQTWAGEERAIPTRDIASVQLSSESRGCARFLAICILIVAVSSAALGIFALALANVEAGLFFLVVGAVLAAPVIIFRSWFFGRAYFATIFLFGGNLWYSGRQTRDRERVRTFVSAVGEALSSRDYGPAG